MGVRSFATFAGLAAGIGIGMSISGAAAQDPQKPMTVNDFPDLGQGLMATPGCLGVRAATLQGGKTRVLFAWFENKKAVEAWYYSKMHMDAMERFFPGVEKSTKVLADFKDENAPVMLIASVTPSDRPLPGQRLAVSQISIEAYTPVPGGAALGETFAPKGLKVPGLMRIGN